MRLRPHIYFRRLRAVFNYPSWLTGIARTLDIGGTFDPPLLSVDDLWLKYDKLAWEKRRMSYEPWAERCPSCRRMLGVQTEMDKLLSAVRDEAFAEARDEAWEEVHKEMGELRQKLAAVEEREAAVCPEEANVLRAPDVEDCPDFKLPAHFTFDPHNKEEQAEIQRRALKHMHWCTRCDPGMAERERLARNYAEKREELRDKVIKAAKLWRKYRIGANEVELEWAVRDLDEYESKQR